MQNFFSDLFQGIVVSAIDCTDAQTQMCGYCDGDCLNLCYEVCSENCQENSGSGICSS